ncbi:helix-turn-helix domain-containing protein [Streptomyces sp. NPDC056661]|uniref:helix-turn-helix domain-containing protein n=1 Tax=Streptomyces sp. NPDC056661 TaxID=3345898 RepID=UPI0036C28572
MRYAQGGALTPQGQAARERLRMFAVDGFARGEKNAVIAKRLRVSARSVERWR